MRRDRDINYDDEGFYVLRRKHERKYNINYHDYGYNDNADAWIKERFLMTLDLLITLKDGRTMPYGEILERIERGEDIEYPIF